MKNLKINLLIIALFAFTLSLTSCGGSESKSHEKMEHNDGDHKDMDNAYSCPMHPEITGKKGDKCSKCGMDLKMKEGDGHEGHSH